MMKVSDSFALTVEMLEKGSIENPSFEADCLFESFFGVDRIKRINNPELEIDFDILKLPLEKRLGGVPLQYIIGKWQFYSFEYEVGDGVLIPRPETEILVEKSLELISGRENSVIFDLCAGSGCIGLTFARLIPDSEVYLFEKSEKAFSFLKKNSSGIKNARIVNEDIFYSDCQKYKKPDFIISNPPYIRTDEIPFLQKEVLMEPKMALDGGEDGLVFYRLISEKWLPCLKEGGFIAVECGETQSGEIEKLFSKVCKKTRSVTDYSGTQRIVIGEK